MNVDHKITNSMNSARQMITKPKEITQPNIKQEAIEDIVSNLPLKELEKLQKENIKLTIQFTELKNKFNTQREQLNSFTANNNTASNQFLPSEFKEEWDSFYRNTISDFFIDFIEYPYMTFHLVQELFFISKRLIDIIIDDYMIEILNSFKLDNNEKNKKYMSAIVNLIIKDYYEELFDSKRAENRFYDKFVAKYKKFYNMMFNNIKEKEFNDILSIDNSKSLKLLLKKIRTILIFTHLNSTIFFEVDDSSNREFIIKDIDESCVDVIQKNSSNKNKIIHCGLIINPPQLIKKNGFYHNLKPIVLKLNEDYSIEKDKEMFIPQKINRQMPINKIYLQERICHTQESDEGQIKKYNYSPRDYLVIGRTVGNVSSLSKQKVYQAIKLFDNKLKQINKKNSSTYNEFILKTNNNNLSKKSSSINSSMNTNNNDSNNAGSITNKNERKQSKSMLKGKVSISTTHHANL